MRAAKFDLPEHLLPIFPTTHPELGDVSQGQALSIANHYDVLHGLVTSVQLEGLRLLLTRFPQQQFDQTGDLEDTVEFFNLVLGTKLAVEEKADLVAFLRVL